MEVKTPDRQTILGSSGAVGRELARELGKYSSHVRLVSRNPEKINQGDELFPAELTDPEQADKAVEGSRVVYFTIGIPYDKKLWRRQWPVLMKNIINACKEHGARLVFFDNVYMYDPRVMSHMTEDAPVRPVSVKGQIRREIAAMLIEESEQSGMQAMIVRAADFLWIRNSMLVELVARPLLEGKKARWVIRSDKIHNFTYIPDAAAATALLGNTLDAFEQRVWHLPTTQEQMTVNQWIDLFADVIGTKSRHTIIPRWMMGIVGLFVKPIRELQEMSYQFDRDYFFDSSRFETKFDFRPTPPRKAAEKIVQLLREENI